MKPVSVPQPWVEIPTYDTYLNPGTKNAVHLITPKRGPLFAGRTFSVPRRVLELPGADMTTVVAR